MKPSQLEISVLPISILMAAEYAHVSTGSIRKAITRGDIQSYEVKGFKKRKVLLHEVIKWREMSDKTKPVDARANYIGPTIVLNTGCISCGGYNWVYHRLTNTYYECPSCRGAK